MKNSKLYTIGYRSYTIEGLIKILKENQIEILVDVRQSAFSIRPEYRRILLSARFRDNGISYYHLGKLGAPKRLREQIKSKQLGRDRFKSKYLSYLSDCGEALDSLWNMVNEHRVCLMCLERDPNDCHRLLIAEKLKRLKSNSLEIINL